MIQDIYPSKLDNQYRANAPIRDDDIICVFRGNDILSHVSEGHVTLPRRRELPASAGIGTYLFSINGTAWYLLRVEDETTLPAPYTFESARNHRHYAPRTTIYGIMTARHLAVWYNDNRFCGRCGNPTVHDSKLRMMACPACGNQIFPKICPAVIAGVVDGDRILLTRYAGRAYKNYALIAGFTEIGETAEETVAREVFEEAGIRVKNIRYWNSQPWGVDCDLLMGFFCEPEDSREITIDAEELSHAGWYTREQIDIEPDDVSLTHNMIRAFMDGRVPG